MRIDSARARRLFMAEPIARLATVDGQGSPHLVPVTFIVAGNIIYSAVDGKPKSSLKLRRLHNIAANPKVCLLVDHYSDQWPELWWVRADGSARIVELDRPESQAALVTLTDRYPQYRIQVPPGPLIAVDVERWSGWSAQ